jgi:hypothetical protein
MGARSKDGVVVRPSGGVVSFHHGLEIPSEKGKDFSRAKTVLRTVFATSLVKRGLADPSCLFKHLHGLERMLGQSIRVDWEDPTLGISNQAVAKKCRPGSDLMMLLGQVRSGAAFPTTHPGFR